MYRINTKILEPDKIKNKVDKLVILRKKRDETIKLLISFKKNFNNNMTYLKRTNKIKTEKAPNDNFRGNNQVSQK